MRATLTVLALAITPTALASDTPEGDDTPQDEAPPAAPTDDTEARLRSLEDKLEERDRLITLLLEREARSADEPAAVGETPSTTGPGTRDDPMTDYAAWKSRDMLIPYVENMPIPSIYERKRVPRRAGMIAGGSVFGSAYLVSTLVAALDADTDRRNTLGGLYVPLVGPWIGMIVDGQRGDLSPGGGWGLAALGVMQATGVGVFAWAANNPRDMLVKKPFGVTSVDVTPQEGGAAVSVGGRF